MGFSFMEAFMDELEVESTPLVGTIVRMKKKLKCGDWVKCLRENERKEIVQNGMQNKMDCGERE